MSSFSNDLILRLGRGVRLQFEKSVQGHVLLYPEGCVDLNDSAYQILKRLPMTVSCIKKSIHYKYGTSDGVVEFIEYATTMKWISDV